MPVRQRIVEVTAELGDGNVRYGSGFLVHDQQVLTAAHVVEGAVSVVVKRPDKVPLTASLDSALIGDIENFDVALLKVADAPDLSPVRVGGIDRDVDVGDRVIDGCWAVGYPEFQDEHLPGGVVRRQTAHVRGCVPPLAQLAGGLLASIEVSSTPRSLPDKEVRLGNSPWQGMSGSAVFAGDRLLGVVTEHAPRRGERDISFTPIDRLFDPQTAPAAAQAWLDRLGCQNVADLLLLPVRPTRAEPDYRATLWDLRQRTSVLLGRQDELAAVEKYAAGSPDAFGPGTTAADYLWVKAGPWAGKTALLAEAVHLAAERPDQLDVVAFFINARKSQYTQEQFFTAVIPQLAHVLDRELPAAYDLTHFLAYWSAAVQSAAESDRHLLLVVDGLDEAPAIIDVLPHHVEACGRVLVASRRSFDVESIAEPGHPLLGADVVEIAPSLAGDTLRKLAEQEVQTLLASGTEGALSYKVLGALTAAGGGLTLDDSPS